MSLHCHLLDTFEHSFLQYIVSITWLLISVTSSHNSTYSGCVLTGLMERLWRVSRCFHHSNDTKPPNIIYILYNFIYSLISFENHNLPAIQILTPEEGKLLSKSFQKHWQKLLHLSDLLSVVLLSVSLFVVSPLVVWISSCISSPVLSSFFSLLSIH